MFCSNVDSSAKLDVELRSINMDKSYVAAYCTKIRTIVDTLDNLDVEVLEKNLVIFIVSGLSPKFGYIAS